MLQIKNLTVKVSNKTILKDFNLTIKDGEIHALLGENGSGKSTICSAILNHPDYQKTSGKILFDNKDITNVSTDKISVMGIYLLAQNPLAIEGVNNIELLRSALSSKGEKINIFTLNKEINSVLKEIKLDSNFVSRYVNVGASGGERKKTEMLHLFMLKPKFIILDEIDSGLDIDSLKIVISSLKKYIKKYNPSILIITHQMKLLNALNPDYVHVIKNQNIKMSGDLEIAKKIEKEGFNETFKVSEND